ncbi:hypothetical protein ARALYDRAFT_332992 [Arabidopsis lyrata subsp. lyrata]|uniref:Terpene synthase N-terminal domain-containing protein n=1 Tax=Arabidopsis lyrata subsp. lyrata TaxID=81972 RepID=D7MV93_ARALL|nr:hypothetical protein ARALYDRAFT_332992 [Arabidopsis lyrata subsp. lyrata]
MESQTTFKCESHAFTKLSHSQWTDYFLSVPIDELELGVITREIEILKPEVRELLSSHGDDETSKRKVLLIQLLLSLGLAFHFENEINDILEHAFRKLDDIIGDEKDLSTISIMFRVFRTYGHNLSSNVFKRFTGDDGKFEQSLTEDAKGILSFRSLGNNDRLCIGRSIEVHIEPLEVFIGRRDVPASYLKAYKKHALFTSTLEHGSSNCKGIHYVLRTRRRSRQDATQISQAKFQVIAAALHQRTQNFYQLDLTSKWPSQFRERIVEAWLAGLMMYYEPQFSGGRMTRAIIISLDELTRLVDCVERWILDGVDTIGDISRTVFKLMLDVFDEIERGVRSKGSSFHLKEMLEELKTLVRANLDLVKWAQGKQVPSFEEHVEVGGIALTSYATLMYSFVGMGETVGKEAYEWNDMSNGFAANAINYYMKQFVVTKEGAILECQKMIANINKIINEELLKTTAVSPRVLKQALNFRRLLEVLYTKSDDIFNCSEGKLKEYIVTLLIDPIRL